MLAVARLLDDPEYCRDRAIAMGALLGSMKDGPSKAFVLMIADEYKKLAEHAEEQRANRRPVSPTACF